MKSAIEVIDDKRAGMRSMDLLRRGPIEASLQRGGWRRRPVRASAVEQAVETGVTAADAAASAAEGLEPPADLNASAEYRRHLASVLVRRALTEAGAA